MNGYLVDTHVLLWAALRDPRLPDRMTDLLNRAEPRFLSAVSVAEIAIKIANGRLEPVHLDLDRFKASGLRPSRSGGVTRRAWPLCRFTIAIRSIAFSSLKPSRRA